MARIELKGLRKSFQSVEVIHGVNLTVEAESFTVFVGPSGCGKSTLLRTFNRMYDLYTGQRSEGEILFKGKNILDKKQDLNHIRAKIGMEFQKPTPFPLPIYDKIACDVRLYEPMSK